jgi:hypothetical protein
LVLEQKIVLPGYRKSYPKIPEMYPCLTFDLYRVAKVGNIPRNIGNFPWKFSGIFSGSGKLGILGISKFYYIFNFT